MACALINASRVFIIGYSFPSTDHHLRTLFYQVNHKRAETKLEIVRYIAVYMDGNKRCSIAPNGFVPRSVSIPMSEVLRTS